MPKKQDGLMHCPICNELLVFTGFIDLQETPEHLEARASYGCRQCDTSQTLTHKIWVDRAGYTSKSTQHTQLRLIE